METKKVYRIQITATSKARPDIWYSKRWLQKFDAERLRLAGNKMCVNGDFLHFVHEGDYRVLEVIEVEKYNKVQKVE